MCFIDRKIVRSDPKWNEMKGTLYAVDSLEFKKMRPRRRLAEVKGTNLLSTSSNEFQAESRSYESKSTGHYEALPLNSFILAQVHFSSSSYLQFHTLANVICMRIFKNKINLVKMGTSNFSII